MNWFLSIFAAFIAGLAGLFASGWAASLHAGWHQMSNREGAVGYFVIFMALLGGFVSFVGGLVIARVVAGGAEPGFFKAAGCGLGFVAAVTLVAILASRLSADIPPTLDGKELVLEVEFRLPAGAAAPTQETGPPSFELGAVSGGTMRDSRGGTLRVGDAREEEGRWIVPATVELFSSRGQRSIEGRLGDAVLGRFFVPLPGRPGPEHLEWSGWLPQPRPGDPPWPDTEPSFRFRVRTDEPAPAF